MKKILFSMLASMTILFANACPPEGTISTPTTGNVITWKVENGVLSLNGGGGIMPDYTYDDLAPWVCNENITALVIGADVTRIGRNAFYTLSGLESITLAWDDLSDITIPASTGTVFGNLTVDDIVLYVPAGTENLYRWDPFWGNFTIHCPANGSIDNITWNITDSVLTIGGSGSIPDYEYGMASWSCDGEQIKSIIIGENITGIGENAFSSCSNLQEMTLPWSNPATITYPENPKNDIFANVRMDLITLHVPEGSEKSYFEHELWQYCIVDYCPTEGEIYGLEWRVENKTLYLDGAAAVPDYSYEAAPWACNDIEHLVIAKEITRIGKAGFASLSNLKSVVVAWDEPMLLDGNAHEYFGSLFLGNVELYTPKGKEYLYERSPIWNSLKIIYATDGSIENLNWHIEYGTLYLSGSGAMPENIFHSHNPWERFAHNIQEIKIQENITSIYHEPFHIFRNTTALSIAKSVKEIRGITFSAMQDLSDITLYWEDLHDVMFENEHIFHPELTAPFEEEKNENVTVHVPVGTKEMYEMHPVWKKFIIMDDVHAGVEAVKVSETETTISWPPVPSGKKYVIGVYSDAACTQLVETKTIYTDTDLRLSTQTLDELSFTVSGLTFDQRYFYTLNTFDGDDNLIATTTGSFRNSEDITGITTTPADTSVRFYPNPASNFIILEGIASGTPVIISDLSGRKLITSHQTVIPVSELPEGVYIIQAGTFSGKLVINR